MAETLREALRERLEFWAALQWAGVLALLWYLLDPSPAQFATTLVSMAVFGLTELATDVYDVRQSVRNVGLGLYALVGGTAMALFDDGSLWLPAVFVLVGVWFVADAVQTVRHVGATEQEPTGREVYHDYVARQVHEAVAERAHTRRELYEALEADDEAVDAAIERLESRDAVSREGSSIRVTDADDGGRLGRLAARIARPLTLELESGERGDGEWSTAEKGSSDGEREAVRAEHERQSDGEREHQQGHQRERETTD
ncbi:MFS transporter [Halosimplex aquaticum]|uniref:MFS transporter n=1 Tax=Halosimplex aquaticum TaxID=3026162 RepID=A0ABD5XWT7_9EURY|nr:MFS transporter [Halosimplex aquaticum]